MLVVSGFQLGLVGLGFHVDLVVLDFHVASSLEDFDPMVVVSVSHDTSSLDDFHVALVALDSFHPVVIVSGFQVGLVVPHSSLLSSFFQISFVVDFHLP